MFRSRLARSLVIIGLTALISSFMPGRPVATAAVLSSAPWSSFVTAVQAVKTAADAVETGRAPLATLQSADTALEASFGQVGSWFDNVAASSEGRATALGRLSRTQASLTASYSKLDTDVKTVVSDAAFGRSAAAAVAAVDTDVAALLIKPSTISAGGGPEARPARHVAIPVVQDPADFHPDLGDSSGPGTGDTMPATSVSRLASSLHSPRAIYDWVRTHVIFTPQWGVIQGAAGCLQSLQCDIQDTADLLAALLRADGIRTRFVTGMVDLRPAQFEAAMGGFTSLPAAADAAADGSIPIAEQQDAQRQVIGVLIEDTWVQADLNSSADSGVGPVGDWVAMDAALKPMAFIRPTDLARIAGVGPDTLTSLGAGALIDTSVPSITGLDTARIQQAATAWQSRIVGFEQARAARGATFGQVFGGMTPAVNRLAPIKGPPGRIVTSNSPTTAIPVGQSWSLTVTIASDAGSHLLNLTIPTSALADDRLTLGYVPASAADNQLITSYGGLYKTPPFLLDVLPVLYLNGRPAGIGTAAVPMGSEQEVTVTFTEPSGSTDSTTHLITAGTFAVVGVGLSKVGSGVLAARAQYLKDTLARAQSGQPVALDDLIGEGLEDQALEYYTLLDTYSLIDANQNNVVLSYRPREMLMTFAPVYTYLDGAPVSVTGVGMGMDLRQVIITTEARNGNAQAAATTLVNIGTESSEWESGIFQLTQDDPAISTTILLGQASASDIPVAAITANDASEALPHLNLPAADIVAIRADADSGRLVLAPESLQTVNGWTGAAWAGLAPNGSFDEIIAGGLAGGSTTTQSIALQSAQSVVNSASFSSLEEGLQITGATGLSTGVKLAENGLGYAGAVQDAADVTSATGNPLKGAAAGYISLAATAVAGLIISSTIASAVIAGEFALGTLAAAALPILVTAGIYVALGYLAVQYLKTSH